MDGQMNQSDNQLMISNVASLLQSGTFTDLGVEQIGIFAISEDGTISVSNGTEEKIQIAQGIDKFPSKGIFYSTAPRKSKTFKPTDITGFRGIKANRNHQGQIVALGYDGVDASKTLTTLLDQKDLIIHIRLWGNLINRVKGNSKDLKFKINVNKGCLPSNCDLGSPLAGEIIADSILKQVKDSPLAQGYKITDLIKASKIKKYANAPSAISGLIPFHKFEVSIPDDGSGSALGLVQAQYPKKEVKRVKRLGIISTYEIWTQDTFANNNFSAATPADVSLGNRVIAECESCPSGSTKVESSKVYELKSAIATSAPTIPNAILTTLVGQTITEKTYLVTMPENSVDTTVLADATADGYVAKLISTSRDVCNFSATTYAWSNVGSATKAPASWKITLHDTECGSDRLSDLQKNYPGFTVALDSNGTCSHSYKITNYSEPVEPGCYPDDYVYKEPSAFEGIKWARFKTTLEVPDCTEETPNTNECVAVGVIFESKVIDSPYVDQNTFHLEGFDPQRNEPVRIEVSVQSLDPNTNLCDEPEYPVTKLQSILMPKGEARFLMQREITSLSRELKYFSSNQLINRDSGFVFNTKDGNFYDEYQLSYNTYHKLGGWNTNEVKESHMLSVFFKEGEGKQFESAINSLIAKQGLKIKPVYL